MEGQTFDAWGCCVSSTEVLESVNESAGGLRDLNKASSAAHRLEQESDHEKIALALPDGDPVTGPEMANHHL